MHIETRSVAGRQPAWSPTTAAFAWLAPGLLWLFCLFSSHSSVAAVASSTHTKPRAHYFLCIGISISIGISIGIYDTIPLHHMPGTERESFTFRHVASSCE
ncbi:hypothetical protein B0H63DRAFT_472004 [Podospora didyma]|uniref:Uncharacterized protein n=1 Tax=Podospora didyma TaxID=330526 RepID=A0AAE0NNW8_9PEZI|nr:hypothetical protein B0H63DRAFT_472004 [Podospora didyma]